MAPPRRSGLNTVTRKRPDGTTSRVYYHLATGKNLGSDRAAALDRAAELDGVQIHRGAPVSTFDGVCTSYLASTRYTALAPKTQALNRLYIDKLRDLYGALPAAAITRPVVVQLREQESGRAWYATHLLSKLRLVLAHGVDIGVLKVNPALRPGGVKAPRRHAVWSADQTARMLAAARPSIRLACALMLYTAQRPADVLTMQAHQVVEREGRLWLSLRQAKTGELVEVPCHRLVRGLIDERLAERMTARKAQLAGDGSSPAASPLLVPSPTGKPWAYRNFSRAWDRTRRSADWHLARELFRAGAKKADVRPRLLKGLQRRDLRRTAMVRMAEAGATSAQIAAVSGHTIDQTSRILDTYIPRRGEVAAGAIDAWEAGADRVLSIALSIPKFNRPAPAKSLK